MWPFRPRPPDPVQEALDKLRRIEVRVEHLARTVNQMFLVVDRIAKDVKALLEKDQAVGIKVKPGVPEDRKP